MEKTSTFDKAIAVVEALPPEDQASLVDIITNCLRQQRRNEVLEAVAESRKAHAEGDLQVGRLLT